MSGNAKSRSTVEPAWLSGGGTSESDGTASKQAPSGSSAHGSSQVKSETTQPKFEPKKPMFVPKVPVKKEAPVGATSSASSTSNSDGNNKHDNKSNGDKGKKNGGGKAFTVNKFTPKAKSVGFSEKLQQGNRKWVMPVGTAFFTGTNAAATAAPTTTNAVSGKTVIAAPTAGKSAANGATRIMRPNEAIEEAPVARVVKSTSASSFVSYQSAPESDSDAEDGDDNEIFYGDQNQVTNEVWPPLEYDPVAPLALPLGPRSAGMRAQLAAEPILADPMDEQALEKEQTSNLFVLQMPSDLKFETIAAKHKDLSGEEPNHSGVRIGKMQLLASGKVRLITVDGRVYEVNSGMASSFVQILASMEMPTEDEAAAKSALETAVEGPSKGASATNGKSKASTSAALGGNSNNNGESDRSVMDLMGSITKKLVITPAGDIGARRARTYSITTSGASRGPAEYLQGLGRNFGEEEEEVVMMEG